MVELPDGTQFQFSTTDRKGIRSNRNGLVLSVLLDGGLSYLLFTGIGRMLGKKVVRNNPIQRVIRMHSKRYKSKWSEELR